MNTSIPERSGHQKTAKHSPKSQKQTIGTIKSTHRWKLDHISNLSANYCYSPQDINSEKTQKRPDKSCCDNTPRRRNQPVVTCPCSPRTHATLKQIRSSSSSSSSLCRLTSSPDYCALVDTTIDTSSSSIINGSSSYNSGNRFLTIVSVQNSQLYKRYQITSNYCCYSFSVPKYYIN